MPVALGTIRICTVHWSMVKGDDPTCEHAQIWAHHWLQSEGIEWNECPAITLNIEYVGTSHD